MIIDIHTHTFPARIAEKALRALPLSEKEKEAICGENALRLLPLV